MTPAGAFRLAPLLAVATCAAGIALAAPVAADCNTVTGSTLCASGTVKGSAGAPTSVPTYNPYPCYGNPACDFYDDYNPGIVWDLPNFGGGNRPQPR